MDQLVKLAYAMKMKSFDRGATIATLLQRKCYFVILKRQLYKRDNRLADNLLFLIIWAQTSTTHELCFLIFRFTLKVSPFCELATVVCFPARYCFHPCSALPKKMT